MLYISLLSLLVAAPAPSDVNPYEVAAAQQSLNPAKAESVADALDAKTDCLPDKDGHAKRGRRCKQKLARMSKQLNLLQSRPELRDPRVVATQRLDKAVELVNAADKRIKGLPDLAKLKDDVTTAQAAITTADAEASKTKTAATAARTDAENKAAAAKAKTTPETTAEADRADKLATAAELVAQDAARKAKESVDKAKAADELLGKANTRHSAATTAKNSADQAKAAAEVAKASAEKAVGSAVAARVAAKTSAEADAAAKDAAQGSAAALAAVAEKTKADAAAVTAKADATAAQNDAQVADKALETASADAELAKATDENAPEGKAVDPTVAKAEAEAAVAKAKAEQAEAMYRDLASGKFIENGITGGLALTLQTPLLGDKSLVQQATAVTTTLTPYLLLVPGYWRQQPETNRFCASHWSTDIIRAQASADEMARQRATPVTTTLLNYVQAGLTLEEVRGRSCTRKQSKNDRSCAGKGLTHLSEGTYAYSRRIACDSATATSCAAKAPEKEELARLIDMMAQEMLDWTPGVRGGVRQCLVRKFGLWVGFPVNPYKARITADKFGMKSNVQREVNPVVSFGLAFAPNATISGLLGVTYSRVTLPTMVDMEQNEAGLWTFTLGIGGNLDIVNAFRK